MSVNSFRNNPDNVASAHVKSGCSVHAERAALKRAGANASGSTVYIARTNSAGSTGLSRPCNNCHKALVSANVKEVIYT